MFSRYRPSILTLALLSTWSSLSNVASFSLGATQAEVAEVSADSRAPLIDFTRDIHPILTAKCLQCHGPEEAKNDFRVDDADSLLSYIEPRDVERSSLWSDYLVSEDEDMRMPPVSIEIEGQLTAAELATIKLWIEEGGMWNLVSIESEQAKEVVPASMAQRIWQFQGLFHPATTHFPIALLTISAGFVFLSYFRPDTCEPVAFHCLWIGALGAIVASAAGWSYAAHEGYGAGFSFNLFNSAIDRHRWMGVAVALVSLILIPVAMYVRRTEDFGMRSIWFIGSLLLLAAVGLAGYQGGELTYGEGHYEKEFVKLFPEAFAQPKEPAAEQTGAEQEVDVNVTIEDGEDTLLENSEDEKSEDEIAEATVGPPGEQREVTDEPEREATNDPTSAEASTDSDTEEPPPVDQPDGLTDEAATAEPPAEQKPAVIF